MFCNIKITLLGSTVDPVTKFGAKPSKIFILSIDQ